MLDADVRRMCAKYIDLGDVLVGLLLNIAQLKSVTGFAEDYESSCIMSTLIVVYIPFSPKFATACFANDIMFEIM